MNLCGLDIHEPVLLQIVAHSFSKVHLFLDNGNFVDIRRLHRMT